jgi:hypothetical protein
MARAQMHAGENAQCYLFYLRDIYSAKAVCAKVGILNPKKNSLWETISPVLSYAV